MRLGVVLMPTDPWPETVATARRLEAMGYDHLWVYDHLSWRHYHDEPWFGTYPWLAGLAAATERIGLGTIVANPNIRHPLTLAKDAMTIDHISSGRFTLGIGAAGTGFDATVLGQATLTPAERAERLEEFVPLVAGLLTGEIQSHEGRWYTVNDGRVLPGCAQRPRLPVAVAAGGNSTLRVAAETADTWITLGATQPSDAGASTETVVAEQAELLANHCDDLGRDPSTISRLFLAGHSRDRPLASLAAFTDFAGRYRELGFTDLVFHHPRPDDPVWNEPAEIVEEIATLTRR